MIISKLGKKRMLGRRDRPHLQEASPFVVKEAYNSIRTKLIFTGKGEKCPVFAVTSSLASDGKTTNAVGLAMSFAIANQKVLLIDADMRKPSVHRYFGLECSDGLSEILAGLTTQIKLKATKTEGLSVLTGGTVPPNPADLLSSEQLGKLLDYARQHYDYVFIDTPPVNVVTDACVLADKVTGYIFVVKSGKNHVQDMKDAVQQLEGMNGNIVGFVLNSPEDTADARCSRRNSKYYRYGRYNYHSENSSKKQR